MSLEVKTGDLVKLSGLVEHRFGVSYGTIIDIHTHASDTEYGTDLNRYATVMMYRGGVGQFTEKLHVSRLEVVFPVDKL